MTTKKKKSTLPYYQGRGKAKMKRKTKQEGISYSNQEKGHDDCCSSALLSSPSQEPEAVLQTIITSGDFYELQSSFGNSEYCLRDRNEVSTCNEDKNVYLQLRDQREENLDSLLCGVVVPEDCSCHILQSPIYTKL